jgi:hypothetical protein
LPEQLPDALLLEAVEAPNQILECRKVGGIQQRQRAQLGASALMSRALGRGSPCTKNTRPIAALSTSTVPSGRVRRRGRLLLPLALGQVPP